MTVKRLIDIVRDLSNSQYSDDILLMWLSNCENTILTRILLLEPENCTEYTDANSTAELLIPHPYDKLYLPYMQAQICHQRREYDEYQNLMRLYNDYRDEYARYIIDSADPGNGNAVRSGYYLTAYAIAVAHGYTGSEAEWLDSLSAKTDGDINMAGHVIYFDDDSEIFAQEGQLYLVSEGGSPIRIMDSEIGGIFSVTEPDSAANKQYVDDAVKPLVETLIRVSCDPTTGAWSTTATADDLNSASSFNHVFALEISGPAGNQKRRIFAPLTSTYDSRTRKVTRAKFFGFNDDMNMLVLELTPDESNLGGYAVNAVVVGGSGNGDINMAGHVLYLDDDNYIFAQEGQLYLVSEGGSPIRIMDSEIGGILSVTEPDSAANKQYVDDAVKPLVETLIRVSCDPTTGAWSTTATADDLKSASSFHHVFALEISGPAGNQKRRIFAPLTSTYDSRTRKVTSAKFFGFNDDMNMLVLELTPDAGNLGGYAVNAVVVGGGTGSRRVTINATLQHDAWTTEADGYTQTVNVPELEDIGDDEDILLQCCPAPQSIAAWNTYGVQCMEATEGTMTFRAATHPAENENIGVIVAMWR